MCAAGTVNQHIHVAKAVLQIFCCTVALLFVGYVQGQNFTSTPRCINGAADTLCTCGVDVYYDDVHTQLTEACRNCRTQATRCAGHDSDSTCQVKEIVHVTGRYQCVVVSHDACHAYCSFYEHSGCYAASRVEHCCRAVLAALASPANSSASA